MEQKVLSIANEAEFAAVLNRVMQASDLVDLETQLFA